MELKDDDLATVWDAVYDVRSKCYDFGVMLKVPPTTLDSIRADYSKSSDQLREILKVWLRTATQRTWPTLVNALKSRIVGEQQLASILQAKYCQDTPGQASGQVVPRDTQIETLQQQVTKLQLHLKSKTQPQQTVERLEQKVREQQRAIEAGERKLRELNQMLQLMKQTVTQPREICELRQKLQKQQRAIETGQEQQRELKGQIQLLQRPATCPQPNPPQQETTLRKLIWWDGPKAPERMRRGSVATDGTTVYFNGQDSTRVHQYHSDTQQWSTLPNLPHIWSTLVMADSKLLVWAVV